MYSFHHFVSIVDICLCRGFEKYIYTNTKTVLSLDFIKNESNQHVTKLVDFLSKGNLKECFVLMKIICISE